MRWITQSFIQLKEYCPNYYFLFLRWKDFGHSFQLLKRDELNNLDLVSYISSPDNGNYNYLFDLVVLLYLSGKISFHKNK